MLIKLKIFLCSILSIGLFTGAIILTVQLAHIPLDPGQNIIDNCGNIIAFCVVLYTIFIACLIYSTYLLYIEYKKKQIDQHYKNNEKNI